MMDADTIRKIADEIAKHIPQQPWSFLLIQVVLVIASAGISAGIGAYFGEYLRTKGKNLATKEDFESLKDQLRENTELVENIKADVGQRDWAAREWRNVRRIKLEEMLTKMHDCEEFTDRFRNTCMDGNPPTERNPIGEMETLGTLYFPELKSLVDAYGAAHRQHIIFGIELVQGLMAAGTDSTARQTHFSKYMGEFQKRTTASSVARNGLNATARQLVVQVAGIDGND
jgi:hypothetical protein